MILTLLIVIVVFLILTPFIYSLNEKVASIAYIIAHLWLVGGTFLGTFCFKNIIPRETITYTEIREIIPIAPNSYVIFDKDKYFVRQDDNNIISIPRLKTKIEPANTSQIICHHKITDYSNKAKILLFPYGKEKEENITYTINVAEVN